MLEKCEEELVQIWLEIPRNHLVVWTGGNVSARDAEPDLVAIDRDAVDGLR